MNNQRLSAFTLEAGAAEVARDLASQLQGPEAAAILFFCSHHHDGTTISGLLRERFGGVPVIGCTTAGAFVQDRGAELGVSAMLLPREKVGVCAGALARFDGGVEEGIRDAGARLAAAFGQPLEDLDPERHIGVVLPEGLRGDEEAVNRSLGGLAPLLSFVGGSAGDGGAFRETRAFHDGEETNRGAAMLLAEVRVPFGIVKTCSFEPTAHRFVVTRANVPERVVYELDGRPVVEAYARAVEVAPGIVGPAVFMCWPLGLMLDGDPWIRSPQRVLSDGGLKFYCQIEEGMTLHLMRSTNLLRDTRAAFHRSAASLGCPIAQTLVFNCILRRLELDATGTHDAFLATFAGMAAAGFHTYGESWLGHINQTCTGIVFG